MSIEAVIELFTAELELAQQDKPSSADIGETFAQIATQKGYKWNEEELDTMLSEVGELEFIFLP